MAPRWLKKLGKAGEIAAGVGATVGVPWAGVIDTAIKSAKAQGGSGKDKASNALDELMGDGAGDIAELEKQLGRKVPEAAAVAYMQGQVDIAKMQIELRYKLLKAAGVV